MNTYLKYQPSLVQFFTFLAFAAGCFGLNILISSYFFPELATMFTDSATVITPAMMVKSKLAQLVGAVISFVLPALLFGYFSSPHALQYVGLRRNISPLLLGASILLLVISQPLVSWLGHFNEGLNFGTLQKTMEDTEAMYSRAMATFLKMNSISDLFVNLFIMALLPAIGEELFFRGALQKSLLRLSHMPVVAVFVSSLVFALLHGTFFKILPIFTLGVILGTVYHVTQNLWYTIAIHFSNNALAVIATYYATRNETLRKIADDKFNFPLLSMLVSLALVVTIIYFLKTRSAKVLPMYVYDEEMEDADIESVNDEMEQ